MRLLCAFLILSVSFCSPGFALVLGSSKKEIEIQKYENLFKPNIEKKTTYVIGAPIKKGALKLKLTNEMFAEINKSDFSKERLGDVTEYLQKRLRSEINIPLNYDHLSYKEKEIATAIRNYSTVGLAIFGVLWALPVKYTRWPEDKKLSEILDIYEDNVKEGPILDKDHWAFNYIGHPLSGAYEYLFLRNKGFSKLESFGFAIFSSTVLWEYGIEAFIETPSIQDLLVTPIIGAALGELFHKWDLELRENDFKLAGSKRFGRIIHHIINPVEGLNNIINRIFKIKFLKLEKAHLYLQDDRQRLSDVHDFDELTDNQLTFGLKFIFLIK